MTISPEHIITIVMFFLNLIMSLLLLWFRAELKTLHVEIQYLKDTISRLEKKLYNST